jgi:hypothetical protein
MRRLRLRLVAATLAALVLAASSRIAADHTFDPISRPHAQHPVSDVRYPYFGFNEARWGGAWALDGAEPLRQAVTAAKRAGANTNRLIVLWFDLIGPGGTWDEAAWTRYRLAYETMVAARMRPIVALVGAPRAIDQPDDPYWAPPGCGGGLASPPDRAYDQQWIDLVTRAALEFPEALAFQIWNEPNSEDYWGGPGCQVDPARYVELVELARIAVAAAPGAPAIPIVSAGLNPGLEEAGIEWSAYLQATLDAGLLARGAQFVGIHPYPRPAACGPTPELTAERLVADTDAQVDRAMAITPAPLWVTELGASSADPLPNECRAIGAAGQAQVLSAMYDRLAQRERVQAVIIHQLVDDNVQSADPSAATYWSSFGVTTDETPVSAFLGPKQAFACLAARRGRGDLDPSAPPCAPAG